MMASMALVALFDVLTYLSSALPSLLIAILGLGLGRGLAKAGERSMLADLAGRAPAPRGRALALQQAAVGLGVAIGALVGGAVVEEFEPRSALLCVSAASVAALGMYALLPDMAAAAASSSLREDAGDNWRAIGMEARETDKLPGEADWPTLLRTSSARRLLSLCQSGASSGYACKIAVVPLLASAYFPKGAAGVGWLLSAEGLSGFVGSPLGGYLADRIGAILYL